jgi:adenylosuccinate lyase
MPTKELIENVLAQRYASAEMVAIWSPRQKVVLERELWLAVLKAQQQLGLDVPDGAIEAYQRVITQVDFASMKAREEITRHDVKARIEEFCALAGYQVIHRGMTSRDLTDNVEQLQIRNALQLVRDRLIAVLAQLAARATEYSEVAMAGRSHNVAAQVTTLGKRLANAGEETLQAYYRIEDLLKRYPLRGMKGPMGTSQDQLELLGGDREALAQLESEVASHLGFKEVMDCVGQIYPRSLDYAVVSGLAQVAAGPSSLATTFRLMAGYELVTEGFKEGQVGSSAMPHKMNARTCERIKGFNAILHGYAAMLGQISGGQWQEGDVSCSVVRRVALADSFFAIDGLIEAFLTVLAEFGAYPAVIERELDRYLPFLATTKILVAAVKGGAGREEAYAAIQQHAKAVALEMRQKGLDRNDFYERLGEDARMPLGATEIADLVGEPIDFIGDADGQVDRFAQRISYLVRDNPEAASYQPGEIL